MICKQSISIFLLLTMLSVFSGANLSAQTKQEKKAAKVEDRIKKFGIGEKAKVKVKLYNKTSYQGYVSQANDEDFVVTDKSGNSNTLRYADVDQIGGKNLSTGAKIAIGVGIGVGVLIAIIAYQITHFDF